MSADKNLTFFNKEGDYINTKWNESEERWEADLLFNENSSDTFKTVGLYTFEQVPSFEFELSGELALDKFQLFNEFGININGNKWQNQEITHIEPVNTDSTFYSKWVYGIDFEIKYPLGTQLLFDSNLFEFTNPNKIYTVVGSKKGAVMIISSVDNLSFDTLYGALIGSASQYTNKTISGINSIGIYNYVDNLYNDNLSNWSEPQFYSKYYNGKKLNLINSDSNQLTVTIKNKDIFDNIYYRYDVSSIPTNANLIIELITKTDLPKIYSGSLSFNNDYVSFGSPIPDDVFKPGIEFKVIGSMLNTGFLKIASIPTFTGNTQLIYYATQSQVLWNNRIYECVQGYTQYATSSISPNDTSYWTASITYLPLMSTVSTETLISGDVYLTNNHVYFNMPWQGTSSTTLASAAEKYVDDFKIFNVDLAWRYNKLIAEPMFPGSFIEVNFYQDIAGPTYAIGSSMSTLEKIVQVEEVLISEENTNVSSRFRYNIVFTDIDEFGIIITINGMKYQEEVAWVYTGLNIDLPRTIDRTIRNWLTRHFARLVTLGIIPSLIYSGNFISPYLNTIVIETEYPNVPMNFDVQVGTTADFHIEHSTLIIYDLGGYLSININGRNYDIATTYLSPQIPDIATTLENWAITHSEILIEYGIYVEHTPSLQALKFDIKSQSQRLDYTISIGKSVAPGIAAYKIIKRIFGNEGMLITSNEVTLPTGSLSLEDAGFATGMVFSINNTIYPYNNQEYNILYLDPDRLNLSYQGPFWGTTDSICNSSSFVTIAFTLGFTQGICPSSIIGSTGSGAFMPLAFSPGFNLTTFNPNTYVLNTYNLNSYAGSTNMVDILYLQLSQNLYALGDNIIVLDAYLATVISIISLPSNLGSIKFAYNTVNNLLYALTINRIYVVDPLANVLVNTITLGYTPTDISINTSNGDIYVSGSNQVDIWNSSNTYVTNISSGTYSTGVMAFNSNESDLYVTRTGASSSNVYRIDGSTRTLQTSYNIPGLTNSIFYEPINSAIYVYGSNLYKIDNAVVTSIPAFTQQPFAEFIFNNFTGNVNISNSNNSFNAIDINNDSTLYSTSIGNYGYMTINQFDGDLYLSSQTSNSVLVINTTNGNVIYTESIGGTMSKLVYNPLRKSVWGIIPADNELNEIEVDLGGVIQLMPATYSTVGEGLYGTLDPDYEYKTNLWLKTRDYIRRPRENFNGDQQVQYIWTWESDQVPEMFIYDFSGDQLPTIGSYSYIGPKPLTNIRLNRSPNKDVTKVDDSAYQQTIFPSISFDLDYIDSNTNISFLPEPLETFIGFRCENEGVTRSNLLLYKRELVEFDITSTLLNNNVITFSLKTDQSGNKWGEISLNTQSTDLFTLDSLGDKRGLKVDQLIKLTITDSTNNKNQYRSLNNGSIFKIRELYSRLIIVDFITGYEMVDDVTIINDYPKIGSTTYLTTKFNVIDKLLGRFSLYGQTEIEDIRYQIELSNIGKNITSEDTFIFKEYDINEGGVDWIYLNKKRKEMLLVKNEIFPYVGSYKAIINAINYFGYNDLELYEYYRNINPNSPNFSKLFKIEVPDIFDNSIEGWTTNDFIKHTLPNANFIYTNLFNLTYKITDKEGNKVITYTLNEVITKLQGLKYWLQRNVIPITHKISDITGRTDFVGETSISHRIIDIQYFNIKNEMTPIDFKINEAYLMPINSGSTVYNCVIDFSATGSDLPDYFNVKIRTYKTHPEWQPFTTYKANDRVIYYDKLYESMVNLNKLNNPKKYEGIPKWDQFTTYFNGQIVDYNRDIYQYLGGLTMSATASTNNFTASVTPIQDSTNWLDITRWKYVDFVPVQTLNYYKVDMLSINFTIDSNIDPFIAIEVTSDNGYGQIYTTKKNYEVRGLLDINQPQTSLEKIGPFQPIIPII